MKKLVEILEEYSLKSIETIFVRNPKIVEDFGFLIADNSTVSKIRLKETDFMQRFSGNISDVFFLVIRREFFAEVEIEEMSGEKSVFHEKLVIKGKYHLKNIGDGAVQILTSSPYSKSGNIIRKIYKPESASLQSDMDYTDFSMEQFLMSKSA